jgi:uncharacterized protein (TIRG00374 family)
MNALEKDEKTMESVPQRPGRLTIALTLLVLLVGAVIVASDWRQFATVLEQADWRPLLAAVAVTMLAYACISLSFALVSRLLGIQMSYRNLFAAGFVSIVLNHVITTGGVAGYSVRYVLMRRDGVALKDVAAASILHFYLTSLDMILMMPVAFLYLLLNATLPRGVIAIVGLMTLILAGIAVTATTVIFSERWLSRVVQLLTTAVRRLLRRDVSEALQRVESTLKRGVEVMRRRPLAVLLVMALSWIDWFGSVFVLWFCFDALGEPIGFGVALTGYVIGMMAGLLSMVPGGVGVQEGSMVGIFVLLGAPFQQALLASILFRGVFFLLPYGISIPFYGRLLRADTTGPVEGSDNT